MQPVSRQQFHRNKYVRITSFEGKNDSFRIATGDAASAAAAARRQQQQIQQLQEQQQEEQEPQQEQQPEQSPMASAGSTLAGEISPESSFTTVILHSDAVKATEISEWNNAQQEPQDSSSSSASSPPTHPSFYSRVKRDATENSCAGEENVCPASSVEAPFLSPAQLTDARVADGAVMLERFLSDDCDGGEGQAEGEPRRVLGNVDTNLLAALPIGKSDGDGQAVVTPKDGTTKNNKKKNKSKKSKGVNDADTNKTKDEPTPAEAASIAAEAKEDGVDGANQNSAKDKAIPPEPETFAEAVKEDPVVAEKRQAEEGTPTFNTKPQQTVHHGEKDAVMSTTPGGKTITQSAQDTSAAESKKPANEAPTTEKAEQLTSVSSQASTTVEYPDIQSDSDDEEERQRRRDKEKAAVLAGARWAPLGVPIKRRLQTAAVLMHCVGMGLTLSIFFFFCAVPLFWPIIIPYLISILFSNAATDGTLSRRNERIRSLPIWTYFAEYFPAKLHKTHELVPTRKYILGYHPHGIISHGAWAAFATNALGFSEKFPGITNCLVTLESNFHLPFYREYVLAMGLQSVSKQAITNILTRGGHNNEGMGRAATIVIGGARESLEAQPKTLRLVINERKGFIKLALQTGADVVPVLAFGENDLYDQLDPHEHPWLHGFQRYVLKAWKFTLPLLHGRGIFNYDVGLMPYRRPLNIVVGKPIPVVQADNPDNTEINRLHEVYVEELQKIWERYKDEFASHRKEEMLFMD